MDLSLQRRVRPSYFRPQKPQDWEPYKDAIAALYAITQLSADMEIMEKQHNFKATISQYKKQLPKWGLDKKRIKPVEYEVIIRKRKHRQEEGKESEVFLRGEVVSSRNIERYERNKTKKAGNSEQIVDSATPPNLDLMIRIPPPAGFDHSGPSMLYGPTLSRSKQAYSVYSDLVGSQEYQEDCADSELTSMASKRCLGCNSNPGIMATCLNRTPSLFNESWSPFFLQSQSYGAGSPSLLMSEASPVIALLKRESGVMRTFEDEVEFQRAFRNVSVEHDCFDCRMLAFISKNTREAANNKSLDERIKSLIEAALFYALKPGACRLSLLHNLLFQIGIFYTKIPNASLEAQECLNASIEEMKASKDIRSRTAMCDLARYYCTQEKEGLAVPLIRELLGDAYRGALWMWRHAGSVDGFCCRCRWQIAPKLTGTKCLDCCRNCIEDAAPEVLGCHFCLRCGNCIKKGINCNRLWLAQLIEPWNTFYAFLLLGLSKRYAVVDMDDPNDDNRELDDKGEYAEWDIPCAKAHHDHSARCTTIFRPQDYLLHGWALGRRINHCSLWI